VRSDGRRPSAATPSWASHSPENGKGRPVRFFIRAAVIAGIIERFSWAPQWIRGVAPCGERRGAAGRARAFGAARARDPQRRTRRQGAPRAAEGPGWGVPNRCSLLGFGLTSTSRLARAAARACCWFESCERAHAAAPSAPSRSQSFEAVGGEVVSRECERCAKDESRELVLRTASFARAGMPCLGTRGRRRAVARAGDRLHGVAIRSGFRGCTNSSQCSRYGVDARGRSKRAAYIPSLTRALLRERNIRSGVVLCRIRLTGASGANETRVLRLPVTFR
jgi:hypothetical protein